MEFRMFGELEVRSAGRPLDVGTPRQQAVLAALVVDARRPVPIEALVDRVWDSSPPADPRAVLYSHLSRIRRLLDRAADGSPTARIERRHAGYVLDVDPDLVDLHRFRRLVEQGHDQGHDDETRAAALADALGLWRGAPLAHLRGDWAEQVRVEWNRRRLDAVVRWAELELRLDRSAAVLTALPPLVAEHPLVEPLESLHMRALCAAGRGAEALARYSAVRQRLADELATDPGPELRALHRAIRHGRLPAPARPTTTPWHRPPDDVPATPQPANVPEPERPRPRPLRRSAALVVAVLLTVVTSMLVLHRTPDPEHPSVERAQALFATARTLTEQGRTTEAQATTVDALLLYDDLITRDPDRYAGPLAPAITQALTAAGIDSSVTETTLNSWLATPSTTPYPAIAQVLLLRGWRLRKPVFLDVVVANYHHTPGVTSPRTIADVRLDVLEAAVLEASNARHNPPATEFRQLLEL
ncbi:BTAD domain-containing putative transcriptional regulator [Actinosynnema sp. NPDC050436]|uniref:AfsR/SARP family transcriptional regulator n=1 Tax=Actinosynnema sp. NPDC050436 TaxID=3155659 RepID=UPI0033F761AF